ncbi:MAG TPA: hypothetical protein VFS22_04965, partial [Flavisolibacter sp.]|nr:hypothetical protein [Flavisolibacter sp.]
MRNLLLLLLAAAVFLSCRKESFTTSSDAVLKTDVDTLHFDTVFTTSGSASQVFKIINENGKGIKIGSVRLAGGISSPFKMNVDGIAGTTVSNIEIAANDSAYVFITVSIDPNASNLPFVVRDSIEISYNGNTKWLQLDAYGQNATFLRNKRITDNEVWNNDLPYVVLGRLTVEPNATLTINEGCKIYIHGDAPFIVNGTLVVNGDKYDSTRVVFSGDRLDEPYKNFPASYPGLIFTETSKNNSISYGIIKNAYQGLVAVGPSTGTQLTLTETIIDNAYDAGIFGINSNITAKNVLVSNCGKNLLLVKGGNYEFTHCTIASYSNNYIQHKEPILIVADYLKQDNMVVTADLNARFRNCLFWAESGGLVKNEVVVDKQGSGNFTVSFDNVLWPVAEDPANITSMTGANIKENPQF